MKHILISGASRGIGKAIAILLAQKIECRLGLIARNQKELYNLQQIIKEKSGSQVEIFVANLNDTNNINTIVTQFAENEGIDILINNAGMGVFKPVEEITLEDWNNMQDLNSRATFLLCQAVLPYFKSQASGHIISIASDAARRTFANGTAYCASKFAQDALLSALRQEVRHLGTKVSTIYPGLVDTYFNNSEPQQDPEKLSPETIAEAVVYVLNAPPAVVIDEIMLHPQSQVW